MCNPLDSERLTQELTVDIVMLGVIVLFFALSAGFVALCERL